MFIIPPERITNMKVAVVGAGKLGTKVIEALIEGGHSVLVIDKNEALLDKLSSQFDVMTVNANGKEIKVLYRLDIDTYDFLLACTDRDEKNIVISSFAKKLGCSKAIARVRDPEHMNQIDFIKDTMNIDYLVNPDLSITIEIYKYLVEKSTLNTGIFTSGKVSLLEFQVSRLPTLIDTPLMEFRKILPDMLAVAISRNGKIIVPHGETIIHRGDSIYVIGEKFPILELSKKVHRKDKLVHLQKVMIIGGGKTGFYLADKLSEFGTAVKVVEKDEERCHYLSSHLNDVMVLHGDATDLSLLLEENLEEMDAFITATGFDEENLLLALIAKQHGVEDVIAKISRMSYSDLIELIDVDMALNPLDIVASNILRFIQGSKRIISSQLIQGQAEIMEIIASNNMALMNKPLKNLKLPHGIIIAAIHRGITAIIPDGNTVIREDDRVIILSLLTEIPALEKLLRTKKTLFPTS